MKDGAHNLPHATGTSICVAEPHHPFGLASSTLSKQHRGGAVSVIFGATELSILFFSWAGYAAFLQKMPLLPLLHPQPLPPPQPLLQALPLLQLQLLHSVSALRSNGVPGLKSSYFIVGCGIQG
uniref:Uncharacterized protein n=1 Tax=Eutreptiella gymnastica TaxID=73025 RepID=A0A7S4GEP5_9EUGL|mmetsp:Transcript_47966/g.78997  ORF Transcript_47966/g.78997 Transcript_47966/m.78997 type:complete len:124 (+) Transcript_47966:1165-1536(+)